MRLMGAGNQDAEERGGASRAAQVPPRALLASMRKVGALGQKALFPVSSPASHLSHTPSTAHLLHRRRTARMTASVCGSRPAPAPSPQRLIICVMRLAD